MFGNHFEDTFERIEYIIPDIYGVESLEEGEDEDLIKLGGVGLIEEGEDVDLINLGIGADEMDSKLSAGEDSLLE